jgi:hypothetical protein
MSNSARSSDSTAKAIGGILLAIAVINVLPRVIGLPDVDLPSVSLPDLPAWADTGADAIHTLLKVKSWILAGVVGLVVLGALIDQHVEHRERRSPR